MLAYQKAGGSILREWKCSISTIWINLTHNERKSHTKEYIPQTFIYTKLKTKEKQCIMFKDPYLHSKAMKIRKQLLEESAWSFPLAWSGMQGLEWDLWAVPDSCYFS